MRIVEIREASIGLAGNVANAVVNFEHHTVSLLALLTDQIRDGQPVVGFGFNSIGRFAQGGILRERMIPRVMRSPEESLVNAEGDGFDPQAIVAAAMRDEKPGGHGDRAGAAAALELAVWDANAKLRGEPAWQTIADAVDGQLPNEPFSFCVVCFSRSDTARLPSLEMSWQQ